MKTKLFQIIEDDSSEPYALIIKLNDEYVFSNLEVNDGIYFRNTFRSCLISFLKKQADEFDSGNNSVFLSQDTYLWVSTENIDFHKYLLNKIEIVNCIEIIDSTATKDNHLLREQINNKFEYYILQNDLSLDNAQTKRIKI